MAERVVRVSLTAQVAGYIAGMEKAAKSTREVSTEAEKLAQTHEKFQQVGRAAMAVGALAAVGVGLAVSKFAEFDKAMSGVQAATHETTENMGALREAALDAGADTVFSATGAARAIEELGKAGVSTADVLGGGLKGSLDLAAAGELGVGEAAEIAASALTQFNLAGSDVPHVADLLAAGAGKAQGSVQDMGAALNQSGLVASQMGLSLEETVGSLAAFASAGLVGSDSGTSFRAMLLRLANPTNEAKKALDDLGIAAYDAGGQFVGMESLAGQLQTKLGGLTQAQRNQTMATVFGQDAIRAANILYTQGAEGIAEWTANVDDAGFAAETAEMRMDNLAGDVEKLGGAFDTALIKTGSAANDALRGITQGITGAVDAFGSAPPAVQTTALVVGGLTAVVGLAGGAFLLAVPKIAAFKVALATMSPAAQKAAGVLGSVGKAAGFIATLGIAVSILDKLANGGPRAAVGIEKVLAALGKGDIETAFSNSTAAADSFAEALELIAGGSFDANMERVGEALGGIVGISGPVSEARKSFEGLDTALSQMVSEGSTSQADALFRQIAEAAAEQGIEVEKLQELFPGYTDALAGANREAENGGGASDELAEGLEGVGSAAEVAEDLVRGLADAIRGFGSEQLDLNDANRAVQASLDDFSASIEENGQTLDITTEKGRANSAALDNIAQSYLTAAAATAENTGKAEDAIPVIQAGRDAIIAAGIAAGKSKADAEAYADSLGLIPEDVRTRIAAETAAAQAAIDNFVFSNDGRTITLNVATAGTRATVGNDGGPGGFKDGGLIPGLAGGSPTWWNDGVVKGPGGPRDDRVAAWLSAGEFVVNAKATRENLAMLHSINSGTYSGGGSGVVVQQSEVTVKLDASALQGLTVPVYLDGRQIHQAVRRFENSIR